MWSHVLYATQAIEAAHNSMHVRHQLFVAITPHPTDAGAL